MFGRFIGKSLPFFIFGACQALNTSAAYCQYLIVFIAIVASTKTLGLHDIPLLGYGNIADLMA